MSSVATSIDDAGDIVGYAIPAGNDPENAIAVRFINQQVVPLVASTPLPIDGRHSLGASAYFRPGPNLTNNPTGNLAFGSAINTVGSTDAYVAAVDGGSFIPQGTYQWLIGAAGLAVEPSADGSAVVAGGFTDGTLWRRIFRSGHPSYKPYDLRVPVPANAEYADPVGISPDGTLVVGYGAMSSQGYIYSLATKQPLGLAGVATGITSTDLIFGFDNNRRPVTWQYTR